MKKPLLVVLIILLTTAALAGCGAEDRRIDAKVFAQDAVSRQLISPSSAKFPFVSVEDCVTDLGDDRFRVTGDVDAQNAFGAMLRKSFSVTLKITGEYSYAIESISIK